MGSTRGVHQVRAEPFPLPPGRSTKMIVLRSSRNWRNWVARLILLAVGPFALSDYPRLAFAQNTNSAASSKKYLECTAQVSNSNGSTQPYLFLFLFDSQRNEIFRILEGTILPNGIPYSGAVGTGYVNVNASQVDDRTILLKTTTTTDSNNTYYDTFEINRTDLMFAFSLRGASGTLAEGTGVCRLTTPPPKRAKAI